MCNILVMGVCWSMSREIHVSHSCVRCRSQSNQSVRSLHVHDVFREMDRLYVELTMRQKTVDSLLIHNKELETEVDRLKNKINEYNQLSTLHSVD